ncbi:hypothetical protein, partial [Chryseobacterium sp. S90]|uniref:hypothetical protein n=1 Tax=Chryseobacterium sp. S90 TaxID=3395373 RepID=UPI0039BC811C
KKLSGHQFYASITILFLSFCTEFYIHFSTGALENSLSFLVLTVFGISIFSKNNLIETGLLPFSIALAFLTRYDFFLIVFPVFIYLLNKYRIKSLKIIFTAGIPIVLWLIFSLLYFGSIFPNSFYMKAGFLGVDYSIAYLVKNTIRSPFLVLLLALGITSAYRVNKPLFIGIVMYFLYTVYVTDYMLGRFWTNLIPLCLITTIQYLSQSDRKIISKEHILTLGILFSFISFCFIGRNKFGNAIDLANERKYYTSP